MLEAHTLFFSFSTVLFLMSGVMVLFWFTPMRDRGALYLAGSTAAVGFGCLMILVSAQMFQAPLRVMAGACAILGVWSATRAMAFLQERRPRIVLELCLVGFGLVSLAWFGWIQRDLPSSILGMSMFFSAITLVTAYDLVRETRPDIRLSCRLLGASFALFGVFHAVRAGAILATSTAFVFKGEAPGLQAMGLFLGIAVSILWCLGYIWAVLTAVEIRLRRSNAELERFSAAVAHDLKAPLSTIAGYLELYKVTGAKPDDPERAGYLDTAVDAAHRMAGFIDMLLISALESRTRSTFEPIAIDDVCRRAIANLQRQIDALDARIEIASLPSVKGDRMQLIRLFQNIFENALKYRAEARAPLIAVNAELAGEQVTISVRDNGMGLHPDVWETVFNEYERSETTATADGIGLGLAECRRIVELHGGRIWVTSVSGEGSSFHFTLTRTAPGGP